MKRVFMLCFFVCLGVVEISYSQDHESGVPYQMAQISNQMVDQVNDVPVNIRRVAVYKLNYNAMRFSVQEAEYIRGEVEAIFREYAGLIVLSPPELEPNDKMKIVGNDSTLQILNIRGRSLADVSPELLSQISSNYGVQGLLEISMQRRVPEGIVLSLRMMNPNSREIVWTKSFISNPYEVEEEVDKGRTSQITFGAGSLQTDSKLRADSTLASPDTSFSDIIVDFGFTYTYRQPLNAENNAYLGFTAGFDILRSRGDDDFDVTMLNVGVTYYQAITEKNLDIDDYRIMLFLNTNVQFPINNTKGEFFMVKPGLVLNMTKNLGISAYSSLILSGETLRLNNNDRITYNKVGYGLHAVIRF